MRCFPPNRARNRCSPPPERHNSAPKHGTKKSVLHPRAQAPSMRPQTKTCYLRQHCPDSVVLDRPHRRLPDPTPAERHRHADHVRSRRLFARRGRRDRARQRGRHPEAGGRDPGVCLDADREAGPPASPVLVLAVSSPVCCSLLLVDGPAEQRPKNGSGQEGKCV